MRQQHKCFGKGETSGVDPSVPASSTAGVDVMSAEPRIDLVTSFEELKQQLNSLGIARVTAVENFLTALKECRSISPKMLQELMVIFSRSVAWLCGPVPGSWGCRLDFYFYNCIVPI